MDEYEDGFAMLRECFLVVWLARAAGHRHLEMAFWAVGLEWWSAERPRWPWVASHAS